MKYLKLFENFENIDVDAVIDELIEWIDNSYLIYESDLCDKVKELLKLDDEITSDTVTDKDSGGDRYSENWNKTMIVIKLNGKDLMKVYINNDLEYNFGWNSSAFGNESPNKRGSQGYQTYFYFDKDLLK